MDENKLFEQFEDAAAAAELAFPPPAEPEEVVLTYRPSEPAPIVLCRRRPLPLSMCPPPAPPETPPAEPAPPSPPPRPAQRRPRHGVLIFCLCCVGLLAVAGGMLAAFQLRRQNGPPAGWEDKFHQYWDGYGEYDGDGSGETHIPSYPVGGSFRLRMAEGGEEILTAGEIYTRVNPSVVTVLSYLPNGSAGVGTGVIMSEDGYIVTNFHVVEGGESCDVLLSSNYRCEAKLVGGDAENDLAVLKVEEEGLPAASFGSSDLLSVGDKAYAIGNPLGLKLRGTMTDGIISAINRDVDVDGVMMTLIQTNAALNSGNSGGPLINQYGQVVGINAVKMVSNDQGEAIVEGLGFAIPSSTVAHIVNCLISTGEVTAEPILGVTVQGQILLEDGTVGIVVVEVPEGYGGDIAGIRPGDAIVAVDGEPVAVSDDIIRARRRYMAGEKLPMTILREGEQFQVEVPLLLPVE